MQVVKEALSSEQVNVAFASPVNGTDALVWLVLAGGVEVMEGAGTGVVPITHDQLMIALVLPAWSVWRTRNECRPLARPLNETGLEHTAKAALSVEHSNVAFASPENTTDADDEVVLESGFNESDGALGAVTSIVHHISLADPVLPA